VQQEARAPFAQMRMAADAVSFCAGKIKASIGHISRDSLSFAISIDHILNDFSEPL
jgi:hypothetical protein